MFLNIDGGLSQIYSSDTTQGGRRRRFLALMVGAPGSPAPVPLRGLPSTFLSVDIERSWTSVITCQGPHRRHFLALMVGAPGSTAPTPPSGPIIDIS
jgi:hypothetical protein